VGSHSLVLYTHLEEEIGLFSINTSKNIEIFNNELISLIPSELQARTVGGHTTDLVRVKEIIYSLIVDFEERA